jgi:hypothetical protein
LMVAKLLQSVHGRMVVYGLQSHVKEVFEMAGFAPVIPLLASRSEALSQLKA